MPVITAIRNEVSVALPKTYIQDRQPDSRGTGCLRMGLRAARSSIHAQAARSSCTMASSHGSLALEWNRNRPGEDFDAIPPDTRRVPLERPRRRPCRYLAVRVVHTAMA